MASTVPITRDRAGAIEVVVRLLKAFESLVTIEDSTMREVAMHHAHRALGRAENALQSPNDLEGARRCTEFALRATVDAPIPEQEPPRCWSLYKQFLHP